MTATLPDIVALQASLNYWIDELTQAIRNQDAERRHLCKVWICRYQDFLYLAIDAAKGEVR